MRIYQPTGTGSATPSATTSAPKGCVEAEAILRLLEIKRPTNVIEVVEAAKRRWHIAVLPLLALGAVRNFAAVLSRLQRREFAPAGLLGSICAIIQVSCRARAIVCT